MSTYIERDKPIKVNDEWFLTTKVYLYGSRVKAPIKIINKKLTQEYIDINYPGLEGATPEKKDFDTGYVHLQFDITSQEYKDFCNDPRVSEFLNNQTVNMGVLGIDFRKSLVSVLETEGIISSTTAGLIQGLFDTWRSQVKDTTV